MSLVLFLKSKLFTKPAPSRGSISSNFVKNSSQLIFFQSLFFTKSCQPGRLGEACQAGQASQPRPGQVAARPARTGQLGRASQAGLVGPDGAAQPDQLAQQAGWSRRASLASQAAKKCRK